MGEVAMSRRVVRIGPFIVLLALVVPVRGEEKRYRTELARAQSLLAAGRAKDSIDVFEGAGKLVGNKSAECFLGLSLAHMRIGEFEDAQQHTEKAVEYAAMSHEKAEAATSWAVRSWVSTEGRQEDRRGDPRAPPSGGDRAGERYLPLPARAGVPEAE
jgi:tetratricopeptide (TPR) repeat protein